MFGLPDALAAVEHSANVSPATSVTSEKKAVTIGLSMEVFLTDGQAPVNSALAKTVPITVRVLSRRAGLREKT